MANSKVLWGIAGLGNIAHRFVKDLVAQVTEAELYAVAARDIQRAKIFAKQYQCQTYFGSYIELATDPNVDVVYVATIHPFHKHLVELFLNHGKHVLVEKPAFTNLKDWDEMANLAKRKGLILAEAMKTVAFPAYRSMKQFITDNNIVISNIEASFGTEHDFDPAWHLFNPRLAGGATLDVGVYGLWLYADLCYLLQASIATPEIAIVKDNDRSEVDENIDFAFKGQVTGRIGASITRNLKREAIITGPDVEIVIHDKWWNPKTIDINFRGEHTRLTTAEGGGGFEYEIDHLTSLVQSNTNGSTIFPHQTSRKVISLMENALLRSGFDCLLNSK